MDTTDPKMVINNSPELSPENLIEYDLTDTVAQGRTPDFVSLIDTEPRHKLDADPKLLKFRKFAGSVVLASLCTVPVADLALSDAVTVKVLQVSQDAIHSTSPMVEKAEENGVVGLSVVLESMLIGAAITRSRRLKGAFSDMEEYNQQRRDAMSKPRRALSDILNAPYNALGYISEKFGKVAEKISARKSRAVRVIGALAVDAAKVNAIGTSSVILQETMAGNPPDIKRNAALALLIATTWVGTAEAIRALYNHAPVLQPAMDAAGRAFETVTTPDNPLSISLLSATAIGLANTGWNIAKFHEAKNKEIEV